MPSSSAADAIKTDIIREKYPHLGNQSILEILQQWLSNHFLREKSPYFDFIKKYQEAFLNANCVFTLHKAALSAAGIQVTPRPSNHKCLQMQKVKKHPKLFTCGITLGKLADETQLGGLNSLISNATPVTSTSDSHPNNAIPASPTSPSPVPSSPSSSTAANILKPPKKRYIVNGEFQCHTPSSTVTLSDNQTHSACTALLQLAEICASSDGKKSVATSDRDSSPQEKIVLNGPSTSQYNCTSPSSTIHQCVQEPQVSSIQNDFQKPGDACFPPFGKASVIQCSNSINKNPGPDVPQHQDEPLNLCKEKEKTYRASNQKLIDHFVDKFLCDTNSHESSSFKPALDPFGDLLSSVKLNKNHQRVSENRSGCFEFSLSAAIESVVDQVYNKDLHETNRIGPSRPLRVVKQGAAPSCAENPKPKNNFSDAVSSDLEINLDEPSTSENQFNCKVGDAASREDQGVHRIPTDNESVGPFRFEAQVEKPSSTDGEGRSVLITSSSEKVETRSEECESKCRLISPPKKSRMWCNIFMDEQQRGVNKSEAVSSGKRNSVSEVTSPVRRNSQRTCKGRRYQALITEGLLQSTKERKIATIKKHMISDRPTKSKSPTSSEMHSVLKVPKKKRKRDFNDQSEAATETEGSDLEKCIYDLDEKISLAECSGEGVKLDSSVEPGESKPQCDSSHMLQDVAQTFSFCDREIKMADSSSAEEDATSTGQFKIGFPTKKP